MWRKRRLDGAAVKMGWSVCARSLWLVVLLISAVVLIGCRGKGCMVSAVAVPSYTRFSDNPFEKSVNRQDLPENLTEFRVRFLLSNLQGGPMTGEWMFTMGSSPFTRTNRSPPDVIAEMGFVWNTADSGGTGSCTDESLSGFMSSSTYVANTVDLDVSETTKLIYSGFELDSDSFTHVNVVDANNNWFTPNEAGDYRNYTGGTVSVVDGDQTLLVLRDCVQNGQYNYTMPAGPSENAISIAINFFGTIDTDRSSPEWVEKLDSQGTGFVRGLWLGVAYRQINCWILYEVIDMILYDFVRGGGDSGGGDGPSGPFVESQDRIDAAQALGVAGVAVAGAVALGGLGAAVGGVALAAATPSNPASPAKSGVVKAIQTAGLLAYINQVQNSGLTPAYSSFADNLDPFILHVAAPWNTLPSEQGTSRLLQLVPDFVFRGAASTLVYFGIRQDSDLSVAELTVIGCGFYSSIILVILLVAHPVIILIMRRRWAEREINTRSHLNYITNVCLFFIYGASIIAAAQYLAGDSKTAGYTAIAILLLIFVVGTVLIGGFYLVYQARKRMKENGLRYIQIDKLTREVRGKKGIVQYNRKYFEVGKYKASKEDRNFHRLYGVFYEHVGDVWIWLVALNLLVVLIDGAIAGATDGAGAAYIVMLVLLVLFGGVLLFSRPFTDLMEGILEGIVLMMELGVLVLCIVCAYSDDLETRSNLSIAITVLGFMALIFSCGIAFWADIWPLMMTYVKELRRAYHSKFNPDIPFADDDSDSDDEKEMNDEERAQMEEAVIAQIELEQQEDVLGLKDVKFDPSEDLTAKSGAMEDVEGDIIPGSTRADDISMSRSKSKKKSTNRILETGGNLRSVEAGGVLLSPEQRKSAAELDRELEEHLGADSSAKSFKRGMSVSKSQKSKSSRSGKPRGNDLEKRESQTSPHRSGDVVGTEIAESTPVRANASAVSFAESAGDGEN